jgi:hypothetical protein
VLLFGAVCATHCRSSFLITHWCVFYTQGMVFVGLGSALESHRPRSCSPLYSSIPDAECLLGFLPQSFHGILEDARITAEVLGIVVPSRRWCARGFGRTRIKIEARDVKRVVDECFNDVCKSRCWKIQQALGLRQFLQSVSLNLFHEATSPNELPDC